MAVPHQFPRACIFDLDGTLVNSLRDVAEAFNECLESLGLPPRPVDDYRYMVGEGIPTLAARAIGSTHPQLVETLTELARAKYRLRPLRYTRPYPGVTAMIGRLRSRGLSLAVLSNKPHELTERIVRAFWPDGQFAQVQGYVEEAHRKPDPFHVHQICAALGLAPAEVWLVGDTPTDLQTAARSGALCIAVTWGFRSRADLEAAGAQYLVDSPDEIG